MKKEIWNLCSYLKEDENKRVIEWDINYSTASQKQIDEFEKFINLAGEKGSDYFLCTIIDDDEGNIDCANVEYYIPCYPRNWQELRNYKGELSPNDQIKKKWVSQIPREDWWWENFEESHQN